MFFLSLLSMLALAGDHVLAVVPFDSKTANEELAPVADGLATMMLTDLGEADSVTMVERERIDALLTELDFQQSAFVDPATAQKIGRILGASALVTGQLSETGGTVRIDARVVDVATGEILVSTEQQGDIDAVFDLERLVALGVLDGLSVEISAAHRKRLGNAQKGPPKIKAGSGFASGGHSLYVFRKGMLSAAGWLWVDGVKVGRVRKKETQEVFLKPGRHEILISDDQATSFNCVGVMKVSQDSEWSTADLCRGLKFGSYGDFGTARKGGLLRINVDGSGIRVNVEGPTRAYGSGLLNVVPGSYSISAKHVENIPVDERPDPHTTEKVTPLCNTVVRVEPDRITLVNVGMAGCGGG